MLVHISAIVFTFFSVILIVFQGCLAAGLPWGKASMGGKYPGKYPPKMRIVAIINMLILALFAGIVLTEAGLLNHQLAQFSGIGIWVTVAFYFISTILNTITPSKIERIWAPVALIQFAASLIIAL